jgi:hypothetical protein
MTSALERFRARFDGIGEAPRSATAQERLSAACDLQAFNLLLTIDQARDRLAGADDAAIIAEVNRQRLASSPMPRPLVSRTSRRDADARHG